MGLTNMDQFDIPVVIFIFKRKKAVEVIRRISEVKPNKLYILADQGRNQKEMRQAKECREVVEKAIDWDCEIIRNYADINRGVYENIGEGAKWVLRQEKWAIFLEDDNLPEISFFRFCREMLNKYENDTRILWVCGTNYLGNYVPIDGASYVFTRHMLPCGWASWSNKFEHFYDGSLELCKDSTVMERVGDVYFNRAIYLQYRDAWLKEFYLISAGKKPRSWDYQMDLTIKANNLFGICPCKNQIKNIGVDDCSVHGGNNMGLVMTRRFCGMDSYPIDFPLKHPKTLLVDTEFERKIGTIILYPFNRRIKVNISRCIRRIFGIPINISIKKYFLEKKQ